MVDIITVGGATAKAWINSGASNIIADPAGALVGSTVYDKVGNTNANIFDAVDRDKLVTNDPKNKPPFGIGVYTQEALGKPGTSSNPTEIGYYTGIGDGDRLTVELVNPLVNATVTTSFFYSAEAGAPEKLTYQLFYQGASVTGPTVVTATGNGVYGTTNAGFFTFELPDTAKFDKITFIGTPVPGVVDASDFLLEKITGEAYVEPGGTPINTPPTAQNDNYSTLEDTPLTISIPGVLGNDSDPENDPLKVTGFTQPANGTITVNQDGSLSYTPKPNFNGTDTLNYTISDGNGGTATAKVDILVTPVNDAPTAVNDSYTTAEDTPLTISIPGVLGNDSDPDNDPLKVTGFTQPANGTITVNEDGSLSYTPNPNFNGTDTLNYTISDGNGGTATAKVDIVVTPVNDAPTAVNDSYTTAEDTVLNISIPGVLGNDSDPENDPLKVTSFTQPANGTITVNQDGSLSYTPNPNFNGTDTLNYTISDGNGGTSTAKININVTPVNDAPIAVNNSYTTAEDTVLNISAPGVLGNDSDPENDPLKVTGFTQPANGTITVNQDGSLSYTPNPNFNGTDTLNYTISDGNGGTSSAKVDILVTPVADPPVAKDDNYTTAEDTPLNISIPGVLGNDSDPDGDPLKVTSFTQPANGTITVNQDGSLSYTPKPNFNGTDTLNYTISDGNGGTSTAKININVTPVNDAPIAVNDSYTTKEDTALTISVPGVLGNDSDPDGDPLKVTSFTQPANGTVTVNQDGSLSYTPKLNFNGTDTLNYTISDGNGGTSTAKININVTPVNDAPIAVNNSYTTAEDTVLNISAPGVLGNDSDPDGDPLKVTGFTQPANGTVTVNQNGSLSYTPKPNFNGTDTLNYTISDGNGGTATAKVDIVVTPVNDAPDAKDDCYSTRLNLPITVNKPGVLSNDTDPDGDPLKVTSNTAPGNGTVTFNQDGSITYTPNVNFTGTDCFKYTISDGKGGTDTATVKINVSGGPQADIKPGSNPSAFNLNASGVLPVAILGSCGFDVTKVKTNTIRLDDQRDALINGGGIAPSNIAYSDVNNDGRLDLSIKFNMSSVRTVVSATAEDLFIYGSTNDGQSFMATNPNNDPIKINF